MSLRINNLNLSYNKTQVLYDINLEIEDGEFFSLLGQSGSGKSTILKTIAGLVQEQSGEIYLGDKALHTLPPQQREVAVVFQDLRLFPNMKVGANVAYPLKLRGVKKAQRREEVERLLKMVHLEGFGERHVSQLSGGQAQRVAIARALAARPRVLLLDEPFSALDENLRESMRNFITEIHRSTGATIIMVTHNQHEALSMSDRIAVMDAGRVMQVGTPREIYHRPASLEIATYLSDASIVEGAVSAGIFRCGGLAFGCGLADGPCKAVIRPAAITLGCGDQVMQVADIRYRGSSVEVVLQQKGLKLRVVASEGFDMRRGDDVSIAIDGNEVLFFSE